MTVTLHVADYDRMLATNSSVVLLMDSNQNPTRLDSLEVGQSGDNFNMEKDDISLGNVKIHQVSYNIDVLM